jgi:cytochrome P450
MKGAPRATRQAPGPRGHWLFGNVPALRRDPLQTLVDAWRGYGDVVHLRMGGPLHAYLLAHPDHVRHVLQDDNPNYPKHPFNNGALMDTIGLGLLTSAGQFWLRQRRLIQPAFHRQRIAELGAVMTDSTERLFERWERVAAERRQIDVASEMMHLTLDIIARSMFSTDVSDVVDQVEAAVKVALVHAMRRTQTYVRLPLWFPTTDHRRFLPARAALDRIVYRFIEERRRDGADHADLLAMLLTARDEETGETMTDEQIRDEVMTIFLAGHETTAVLLTWTFYQLSTHPEIAERHRAELASVLAGRTPSVADLANLSYNRMIVEETMRLYPPAWALSRMPLADDVIGGFRIPKGVNIFLSPYITHRHPEFWENPEGFDPERFSPERSAGRPRYAYLPFGGGPRQCIGNNFALMEAQLILATIAQRYRLDLAPAYRPVMQPMITLRVRDGMPMVPRLG